MKVFVGNLDFNARQDAIRRLFNSFRSVRSVEVPTDWETGRSRGFALVSMSDDLEAREAISRLDGETLNGRPLSVREAPPALPIGFDSLAC